MNLESLAGLKLFVALGIGGKVEKNEFLDKYYTNGIKCF